MTINVFHERNVTIGACFRRFFVSQGFQAVVNSLVCAAAICATFVLVTHVSNLFYIFPDDNGRIATSYFRAVYWGVAFPLIIREATLSLVLVSFSFLSWKRWWRRRIARDRKGGT